MKVLDLDMDFFLTNACPLAPLGERPPEACAEPYSDEQVIRFLEMQCGLSRAHPDFHRARRLGADRFRNGI